MSRRTARMLGRPWQDVLFAAGEVVFLTSLIPLLFDDSAHVPVLTGVATGVMLLAFAIAHASYRNWMTVALSCVTAVLWLLIGFGVSL